MALRDPRDLDGAGPPACVREVEGRVVVVLHRLAFVADVGAAVARHRAEGERSLGDDGRESAAADGGDVAAEELHEIGDVAAEVGERAGTGGAAKAPTHRRLRVGGVVRPVPGAHVVHLAEYAGLDELVQVGDARGAAEGEADAGDRRGVARGIRHRLGVFDRVRQRLLAQHVLACGEECLDDLAVQRVGDHDAHHVDVVGVDDRLPRRVVALVAEPLGGRLRRRLVYVGDRDQADRRKDAVVQRRGVSIRRRVRLACHSGADDSDADAVLRQRFSKD